MIPPSTINYSKSIEGFSKIFEDLIRFTYVLRSPPIIQDLLRFHHPVFPFLIQTIEIEYCVGPTKKQFPKMWCPVLSRNMCLLDFRNVDICKKDMF